MNQSFCVFEKELLIHFLHKKLKLSPVTLGLAFFGLISLSLCAGPEHGIA